jgi:hypothetical protein
MQPEVAPRLYGRGRHVPVTGHQCPWAIGPDDELPHRARDYGHVVLVDDADLVAGPDAPAACGVDQIVASADDGNAQLGHVVDGPDPDAEPVSEFADLGNERDNEHALQRIVAIPVRGRGVVQEKGHRSEQLGRGTAVLADFGPEQVRLERRPEHHLAMQGGHQVQGRPGRHVVERERTVVAGIQLQVLLSVGAPAGARAPDRHPAHGAVMQLHPRDNDSLGGAGGARGEHDRRYARQRDVGQSQVLRRPGQLRQRRGRCRAGWYRVAGRVHHQEPEVLELRRDGGDRLHAGRVDHRRARSGRGEVMTQQRAAVIEISRYLDRAEVRDAQPDRHALRLVDQHGGHGVASRDAACRQRRRPLPGAPQDVRVGPGPPRSGLDDEDPVGMLRGARGDQRGEGDGI